MKNYYSLNTPKSTQFLNKDIKVEKTIRPHIPIKTQISNLFETENIYAYADDNITVLEKLQCRNGLVAAVLQAYNGHQHLCFSPDDIWLTIAQGINSHINNNSDKYKNKFVKFNEQQRIILNYDNISTKNDWSKCVEDLVEETTKFIEKVDLKSILECNFSTSTSTTITASRLVLLDSVKKYFSYDMEINCGIPKITLEGKLEDWLLIQEKLIQLRNLNLDLDFWLNDLDSIIYQFIETFKGNVDKQFWQNIAREDYGCGGPPELSGWITKFFPYDCHGNLVDNWLDESNLPDGRITIKFNIEEEELLFVTGFLGVRQQIIENSNDEVIVKPVIGWAIIDEVEAETDNVIIDSDNSKRTKSFLC